ncbi:MAG: glycosyltransferase family 4 protein [Actinomycetota bacterium]|nr:glycosyltransferase family 4 protein [Actinomycetota bacterium]
MTRGRVCMFLHNAFTHDTRVLKEAKTLSDAGYEVRVLAVRDAESPDVERRDGFMVVRIASDPVPTRLVRRLLSLRHRESRIGRVAPPLSRPAGPGAAARLMRAGLRLHLLLEQLRYLRLATADACSHPADIYLAHDLETLPAAVRAATRTAGARVVYDSHELFTERTSASRGGRLAWRVIERRLIGRADAVITVSESIAEELARRYGIHRPVVVRNLPSEVSPGEGLSPLREQLGIDPAASVALYLGGLQPGRGLEPLIRAAALLDGIVLVLMGPGHAGYVAGLREAAQRAGVQERTVFAPPAPAEEVVAWARGADVGVAPIQDVSLSYYLSLPNKLFDYIAAGLPIVASDFPEIRRVVEEGGLGALCRPDDPADIARAIRWVLADPVRRQGLRDAAGAAAPGLTWEREAEKLLRAVERG